MNRAERDHYLKNVLAQAKPRYYTHAVLAGPRHGCQLVALTYSRPLAEHVVKNQQAKARCGRCPGGCFHIQELPTGNTPAWHQSLVQFMKRNR